MKTKEALYKTLAKHLGVNQDHIKIKVYKEKEGNKTLEDVHEGHLCISALYPKDKTFYYNKLTDYKQISFTC